MYKEYTWFTSRTGYADDIFHVISNFHVQRSKFGVKFGGQFEEKNWT